MPHPSRAWLSFLLLLALLAPLGRLTGARGPVAQGATPSDESRTRARLRTELTVPAGFEIRRIAGPPLVNRPIVADFDDDGHLYVADSSGSNDPVEKQLAEKPHRILRLEDRDGDGTFDASTMFADRMMLPEGTMWFDGSLYVAAPPSIWKLTDTDGDGVADEREEWFQGKTLTHCANDLHGPYLGPDGWIYWAKGAFAEQTYERPGKPPLVTRAAHIFRRRPGDEAVEPVLTGGMDNPVDVAFTPSGERILTATFLEHPRLGRRDAVLHAIYGGVYGKPHAVIDGHPQTGDLMPTLCNLGPAAPAGLTRYGSTAFGPGYRDNFFVAQFNMAKVTRHVLKPAGATFTSRDSDFVSSTNRDFHPTDVIEDADGSLLVVDTGAWYKLCCPTSQMAKPDVLGGIYRIRRKGAPAVQDPRGKAVDWAALTDARLASLLDDPRPAVQQRAVRAFGKRGDSARTAVEHILTTSPSPAARLNAVWALTRIAGPSARAAVRVALGDRDATVRHAALHSVAVWRDGEAATAVRGVLRSPVPALRRVAAEALGRIGAADAVPDLLATSAEPLDRTLEHSVTYALIEIGAAVPTREGLSAASVRTRHTALVALDQMGGRALRPADVVPLFTAADEPMRETAWWVAGHHAEWGADLATFFEGELKAVETGKAPRPDLHEKLAQFGRTAEVQALLARVAQDSASAPTRLLALRAMAVTRVERLPDAWVAPVAASLGDQDSAVAQQGVMVLRALPPEKDAAARVREALLRAGGDASAQAEVRLEALAAIDGGLDQVPPDLFAFLRSSLDHSRPAAQRMTAAGIVERARLDRAQLLALAEVLRTSGPLELPRLLAPFERASEDEVGNALIEALTTAEARASVRPDVLRKRLAKYSPAVQQRGEALIATLAEATAKQARELDRLLGWMKDGDPRRGQMLFNNPTVGCSTCHAIGYHGGKIGPDLTSIGEIREERDLLEAVVFPSASFPRGFEPLEVTTTTGTTYTGVLRDDLPDTIVLTTATSEELRVPKSSVKDVQPSAVSLMPPGYGQQLTPAQLADLVTFLKRTRWGAQ
jgi:putative membrane-bound dehydrogenase-like protein